MKTIWSLLLVMLVLSGCSGERAIWETVEDSVPVMDMHWQDRTYKMTFGIPDEMELVEANGKDRIYASADGSRRVCAKQFLAADLDTAVQCLSGLPADNITIFELERFDMKEYRFVWYEPEANVCLHSADILMDGNVCYSLVYSKSMSCGQQCENEMRNVFASLGLHWDEGV